MAPGRALLAFAMLLCACAGPRAGEGASKYPGGVCTGTVSLAVDRSTGVEIKRGEDRSKAPPPPAGLVAEPQPPKQDGDSLELALLVKNPTGKPMELWVLTGGEPLISTNPFALSLPWKVRGGPFPRAEVYPEPEVVVLPPGGTVRYVARVCLRGFEVTRPASVQIPYSLVMWTGQGPSGTFQVDLR